MKKLKLKSSTIGTITAICAAFSAFMFGLLSLSFMIERHDPVFILFASLGFVGMFVMWSNRK